MLKYQVWECDNCGKTEQSTEQLDGFPKAWFEIQIRKGDYYHNDEFASKLDKDCCSQECVNKVLMDYYSGLEG